MTKALLSRHGIPYESLDVENDPAALAALHELGPRTVPVVAVGERYIQGWNPPKLAELVGFNLTERISLPADQVRTLGVLLDATLRVVRQVPDEHLTMKSADRDRPLRQLAHHTLRVIEAGMEADVLGEFPAAVWLANKDIPAHTSAERIARYGESIQAKFQAWYRTVDPAAFERTIDADVGPRTLGQIMERTKSHAAQHLRQMYAFLGWMGIEPDRPLTEADLADVDLPDDVF